ncbi:MAG TPA: trypsin-like peptidase domain-containing protein [Noviherbaspirillum sp.]|uniref:S1C family serine protease n=1 Tax=Noviherbaspirillum sp. TaxID=1926288 RepID=UPI002D532727|nr:trypsin-like peptidase domain-containing protein [Noviherbaspirillum sp.]HYD96540.1 trypsin-like peptidase domain-containing protein [Noviherbaspirillum sp.]
MKRTPIHSRSARRQRAGGPPAPEAPGTAPAPAAPAPRKPRFVRTRAFVGRHEKLLLVLSSVLLSTLLFLAYSLGTPEQRRFTQRDIDAAVMHTLEKSTLPSPEARAIARIRPSVVRVTQQGEARDAAHKGVLGVGTGVVVVDKGIILTNLHVVGNDDRIRIKVQFANGQESDATVLRRQPENDLAVLQAAVVPDDLVPATLRSVSGLAVGDHVAAVGFPYNIGPSASSGIVSGLNRTYRGPRNDEVLRNLIQFDAAANPGNSGGPLVTMDGEVVGIVTAILSPHEQGTFIGIGFAVPIEIAAAAAGESPF